MNKDKIIKDLKERNDKLQSQYRLRDIRCVHLEYENQQLQQRIEKAIEFIEHKEYGDEYSNFVVAIGEDNGCPEWACEELLQILKGEEK